MSQECHSTPTTVPPCHSQNLGTIYEMLVLVASKDRAAEERGRPTSAPELLIELADPQAPTVRALLESHLALARTATPPEYSFALDVEGLIQPEVSFFAARRGPDVVGVGALKRLDPSHAEVKSMHTRPDVRGQGVGMAMIEHLLAVARRAGYRRVSLETGTTPEFAAARALYSKAGFRPCAPFGDYAASPYNAYFTISLEPGSGRPPV